MEFKELLMARYATKKFDGKTIDDDKIDQLFEMIRYAPSALNLRPGRLRLLQIWILKEVICSINGTGTD